MFIVDEILKATQGKLISGDKDLSVKNVSTDTRTISEGSLFIALKGDNFDGHNFIKIAFEKGAIAAIVSKLGPSPKASLLAAETPYFSEKNKKLALIKTKDTKKALGDIARFYRQKLEIRTIGITGSNGKTTTKDMAAHILSKKNKTAKTTDTENNLIGVPLTLLKIRKEAFAVIEMGTNIPGEIDYLAGIVKPDIGIITNIGPSHLEGLKTLKGILKEKISLFNHLANGGYAVINKDDPFLTSAYTGKRKITYAINNKNCDYAAGDINITKNGTDFVLNKRHKFTLPVFGLCNVYNALAAISACRALGINIEACSGALSDFKPAKMRFNILTCGSINIINDAYNSNPLSMKAALEAMGALKFPGRKIVVTADMLELGKDKDRLHYEIGSAISKSCADVLITVGKLSRNTAKGALENGMKHSSVRSFENKDDALGFLLDTKEPNDTILVKGSRAMNMENLIQCFITSYTR
ncbi:MAG: UDP-N-acetylmuramoyl-tripeptide--D-alanyl-D-alanine ligase [Candidatus Omnitrophica bacterium]|nr:UDP-N-acetylmuramoyl-tripeptide--D-alanyl-D-alanine ligase [Candidatus Omnitrophota bacterium]